MKIETFVIPSGNFPNVFFMEGYQKHVEIVLIGVLKIFFMMGVLSFPDTSSALKKDDQCEVYNHLVNNPISGTDWFSSSTRTEDRSGRIVLPSQQKILQIPQRLKMLVANFFEERIGKPPRVWQQYDKYINLYHYYIEN